MSDPTQLISTTDYPRERPLKMFEGNFAAGGSGRTIAHGLPFIPLFDGYFSLSSDFSNRSAFGDQILTSDGAGIVPLWRANSTNLYLTDISTGLATIYYRLFALADENSAGLVTTNADNGIDLQDTTDYNYAKVVAAGTTTIAAGGTFTVTHNYGDLVYVIYSQDFGDGSWGIQYSSRILDYNYIYDTALTITVTATQVVFTNKDTSSAISIKYEILGA